MSLNHPINGTRWINHMIGLLQWMYSVFRYVSLLPYMFWIDSITSCRLFAESDSSLLIWANLSRLSISWFLNWRDGSIATTTPIYWISCITPGFPDLARFNHLITRSIPIWCSQWPHPIPSCVAGSRLIALGKLSDFYRQSRLVVLSCLVAHILKTPCIPEDLRFAEVYSFLFFEFHS